MRRVHKKLNSVELVKTTIFILLSFLSLTIPCLSLADAPFFRDDFAENELANEWTVRDGYAIQNPLDTINHANFIMTGSHLSISFPDGFEHNGWWLEHAQVTKSYQGGGVYEIKVDSDFDGSQQFGLVFQSAPGTFMMFMLYSDSTIWGYVERFVFDGLYQSKNTVVGYDTKLPVPHSGPYYLRVTVIDDPTPSNRQWRFDYSLDGNYWINIADNVLETNDTHSNIGIIQEVGLFAGNQPPDYSAFDAKFDYYETSPLPELYVSSPSNVIAVGGDRQVFLTWSSVADAVGYNIYRSDTPSTGYSLVETVTGTNHTDSLLTNEVKYYYIVTAYAGVYESYPSYEVVALPRPPSEIVELPPDGLILNLKADALPSLFTVGESVTQWPDAYARPLGAFAHDSYAPTLETGAYGGKVVRFDGNGQYLSLPEGFKDFTNGLSLFIVSSPASLQDGFKYLALGNGADRQMIVLGRNGTSSGLQYFTNNSSASTRWFNTVDALFAGWTSVISVVQSGGAVDDIITATISRDGVSVGSGSVYVPSVATRAVNYIGKSYWDEGYFQGDIAEIILYNRSLSISEQESVNAYLKNKYVSFTQDSDGDGLSDVIENGYCTLTNDADTDDDGVVDGIEDTNFNGIVDEGETNPCSPDSDGDRVQDGTEIGLTASAISIDTDLSVFIADEDTASVTYPTIPDTDGDGFTDGEEDSNYNGMVELGETDPTTKMGDVDGNRIQDLTDLILALKGMSGLENGGSFAGDRNGDMKIGLADAIYILQKVVSESD